MNYGQIREYDIANGLGIRATLFVTGCSHHCKGCFNQEYLSHAAGEKFTRDVATQLKDYLKHPQVAGSFKNESWFKNKDIWCYSGYTLDQIINDELKTQLLKRIDVLVDGKFVEELKDPSLKFRGSSNQNIYKIKYDGKTIKVEEYLELL